MAAYPGAEGLVVYGNIGNHAPAPGRLPGGYHRQATNGQAGPPGGMTPAAPDRTVQLQREQVLRRILAACADGRLEAGELAARTEAAQPASSVGELQRVIADLPGPAEGAVSGHRRGARRLIVGFLGGAGGWRPFRALGAHVLAAAAIGEVLIDLRRTPVTSFDTEVAAVAVAGEVQILVPPGMRVATGSTFTAFGRTDAGSSSAPVGELAPAVRVRSIAVFGNVLVRQARSG